MHVTARLGVHLAAEMVALGRAGAQEFKRSAGHACASFGRECSQMNDKKYACEMHSWTCTWTLGSATVVVRT
jgi:hypothetical protein